MLEQTWTKQQILHWTVLSQAIVYENAWILVKHQEILNPAGGPGIYGTVHFKNHAIGIVPIDEKGNVVLVGQYRFPTSSYSWEIPEGGGLKSVPILEAAVGNSSRSVASSLDVGLRS